MRIAVRALVVLALPMLAFGWLTSAQLIRPPVDSTETIFVFSLLGVAVAGLGSAVVTAHALYTARPVPLAPLTVTGLAGIALIVEFIRIRQYNDALDIWSLVLLAWGGYLAGALFVIVGVRSLIGLWSMPDLPMLPTRKTIVGVLLCTALAAATHADQPVYLLLGTI
ncbi:hypothetical protein OJ998_27715 [Solirubrobacter taibaiensis]|nr:hypothetical protein [Solirubrobacter taibaiensis]